MKKYWKVKVIEDMLKIKGEEQKTATVTMGWIHHKEEQKELMQKAYEDGWNDACQEDRE